MTGVIKNIITNRDFGFIRCKNNDYFFHREDLNGHWEDLVTDMNTGMSISVSFDEEPSNKGPRAKNVSRLDFPNR